MGDVVLLDRNETTNVPEGWTNVETSVEEEEVAINVEEHDDEEAFQEFRLTLIRQLEQEARANVDEAQAILSDAVTYLDRGIRARAFSALFLVAGVVAWAVFAFVLFL